MALEGSSTERYVDRRVNTGFPTAAFGRRISWGALFGGTVAALFVDVILSTLGTAIGANVAGATNTVGTGLGVGAAIWLGITAIVALFIGGWVAGRLSGIPRKAEGMLHGFLTAGLSCLFVIYLLTTAMAGLFGAASHLVGSGLQGAGSNPSITQSVANAAGNLGNSLSQLNPGQAGAAASQAADTAAKGVAAAGYGAFLLLLLACASGIWGGYVSAPKELRRVM